MDQQSNKSDQKNNPFILIAIIIISFLLMLKPIADLQLSSSAAILVFIILVVTAIIYHIIPQKPKPDFLDELNTMLDYYRKKIKAEKKHYRNPWSVVELWQREINDRANQIKERYRKEGETESVLQECEGLGEALNNGLMVIQDGNNPLVVKEGKGREYDQSLPLWGKILFIGVISPFCFVAYIALSAIHGGILALTIALACGLFPFGIFPLLFSILPRSRTLEELRLFNFKHFLWILFISALGYILNRWTYAQSETIQIGITIGLPILYGFIYYQTRYRRKIKEL